jgi:hypothetical protein
VIPNTFLKNQAITGNLLKFGSALTALLKIPEKLELVGYEIDSDGCVGSGRPALNIRCMCVLGVQGVVETGNSEIQLITGEQHKNGCLDMC